MSGHSWHLTETYRGLISRALRMDDWPRAYFPLQSFSENEVPERVPLLESMAPSEKAGLEWGKSSGVTKGFVYTNIHSGFRRIFPEVETDRPIDQFFFAFRNSLAMKQILGPGWHHYLDMEVVG